MSKVNSLIGGFGNEKKDKQILIHRHIDSKEQEWNAQ